MSTDAHDLVIAGSGIAGLSAAVYAARADLDPLVLEGDEPGGQLTLTTDVENYLGFPDGVGGMDLVQRGKEQAEKFGAQFQHGRIDDASLDDQPFELSLSTGDTIRTRALVVATGASARWVGAENEDELMGYGLSTCATCDGAFHRGDDVLVIGGGDSAMEEALFLAKFADSVTVVHRREELRASEIMADRARDHDDVEFRWNTELEAIHGSQEDGVTGATLISHPDGYPREKAESGRDVDRETVDVGGVFYAVGHTPNTRFLDETGVERDESGYVFTQTDDAGRPTARTTVDGVFAAGDVADPRYRQAITSAGTGSMAALDAEEFLETRREADEPTPTPTT
ncbi:NAD(P)/FAD-dependent oxidoreductase [Salarchaeum sp. JOR-1]|uniref:NAD(P)/FAD-dependent oxidoreductase n=1 Tax=Salarchaeum sp. JOR-1 TaxID=2599399 RepID=UPI001198CA87|nr:FAD-dependent oxidoreductase [Salarchaeum sp. JOR-1]QDX39384.1 FAD-binding protein [Salarchaeum sp. JOR-1]